MDKELLLSCKLCPRECGVNRLNGEVGYCGADARLKIGRAALHMWEEPPISGERGSGTVFFSHCNMGCVFCQNYQISAHCQGRYITEDELSKIFLDLQQQGAHNINLVTPTHYIPMIAASCRKAKEMGLNVPIVYNCGGYESVEALSLLDGIVDIYMPDMKYYSDKYAIRYSNAPHYFEHAKKALAEMYRQVGEVELDGDGIMKKGIIVRHMLLPGLLFDAKKIIDYLHAEYGEEIYLSIMSQYTPMPRVVEYPEINKKVSDSYYAALVDYAVNIGVTNAFVQSGEAAQESFIPEFYKEE